MIPAMAMAGDKSDTRRIHRRSPNEGAEELSKRWKHSHHLHHHSSGGSSHDRHRSNKQDHDSKYEEDDIAPPVFLLRSNSNPDDEKEEGEILEEDEEEDCGVGREGVLKKKVDSDVESGEIKPDELVDRSDNRDREVHGEDSLLNLMPDDSIEENAQISKTSKEDLGDDMECNFPVNVGDKTAYQFNESSDGEDIKFMQVEPDIFYRNRYVEHDGTRDIDGFNTGFETLKSREKKGERQQSDPSPRDGMLSFVNGDIGYKTHEDDRRLHADSGSSLIGAGRDKYNRDAEVNVSTRHVRSRSPAAGENVDLRKNRKIDDHGGRTYSSRDFELHNSMNYESRQPSESMNGDSNGSRDKNKSVSPESMGDKYKIVACSPSHERFHDEVHSRDRSRSHMRVRERRSRSHSVLQDGFYRERDANSHRDIDYQMKLFDSQEKDKNNIDRERVVRHNMDDRLGSRDLVRDRERELSSSYSRYSGREDRYGSREKRDRDRDRGRERETEKERDRDRERDTNRDWDQDQDQGREREKERARDRARNRERERGRDKDRSRETESDRVGRHHNIEYGYGGRDGYKNSRRLKHDELDHWDRKRRKDQAKVVTAMNDDFEGRKNKLQRDDEDEEEAYEDRVALQFAEQEEEDVDRIKEESRKRRQAILEKYKQQQLQQQVELHSEGPGKEEDGYLIANKPTEQPSPIKPVVNATSKVPGSRSDNSDNYVVDPSYSIGKSPPPNGTFACERTSAAGGLGDGTPKSEKSLDMFCDDIFGDSPAGFHKPGRGDGLQIESSGLHDNWDDAEGYYSYRFGEVLDGRYEVTAAHGKGVYSTVVRAKDLKAGKGDPEEVAIKIIRSNDTMYKAGLEELIILKKLAGADPDDRRHCVRFHSSFKYRNHLCLVFESLHMNLREVLKKFGRNIGLKLTAVRAYAKQLFIALKHLRNCRVLHCDIKPDNMLVNETKNVLKLCDFGNAMFSGKNEITPYLVSRFYRAPEIILGLPYDHPLDIWSVGCCLYELYLGKVLFPGPSNNDMLRLHMELKGPFPKKMLRKGAFIDQFFDHDLNFHASEEDPVTKKTVKRLLLNIKPKDIGTLISSSPGEDPKMLANFKDLLERIFVLDPEKRMTVSQALSHPFITGK